MQFDLRLVPLFAATLVSLGLGFVAWRRPAPGARAFAILVVATAEWAATYAFEMLATDVSSKLLWEELTYLGSVVVAPAWLVFTLAYTEWRPSGRRRLIGLLLLVQPCIEFALIATNDYHGLMWSSVSIERLDPSGPLKVNYAVAYWAALLYDYAGMLSGLVLIARYLVQAGRLYSRQALALLIGVAVPLLSNIAYNTGGLGTLDPTPYAFTVTWVAFFWGFVRYRFLDLAPVARNSIFQVLRDAVVVLDLADRVVDLNPAAESVVGRVMDDALGRHLSEVLPELSKVIHGLLDGPAERLHIQPTGATGVRQYDVHVSPLHGRTLRITGRVVVMTDISKRLAAEASLHASHLFIQEVIANAGEGIVVYDRTLRYEMWNPFMVRLTGVSAAAIIGRSGTELLPNLGEQGDPRLLKRALEGETVQSGDTRYRLPETGVCGWYMATYTPRRDAAGQPDGVIGILHDITERKRAEEVLSHLALHDTLTDLPNRALLQTRLTEAIADAARKKAGLALLEIDLDRFKDVNDTLGHACGDQLLQELAQRWQVVLREGDTLARIGGDEFAVVLPGVTDAVTARRIAAELHRALVRSFVLDGHSVEVGASIGIAMFPEHGHDVETLLRHADLAMYSAKHALQAA